jgi:GNAT superfamily N-acetyltransferase
MGDTVDAGDAGDAGDAVDAVIRRAHEADLDDMIALYEEFHAFHVHGVPDRLRLPERPGDPELRAEVRELLLTLLRDPEAALFVAEVDGALIGLAEVYLRRDAPHPLTVSHTYGYLQSLVVTAEQRGRGLGTRLVVAAENWARGQGATQLRLETWEFPASPLPFYEALGYRTAKRALVKPLG